MKSKQKLNTKVRIKKKHSKKLLVLPVLFFVIVAGISYVKYRDLRGARADTSDFADISSPQCDRLTPTRHNFGIVGLNGTQMNFASNPCLLAEIRKFRNYDIYVGANYPSAGCRARGAYRPYHCGTVAAEYNLQIIDFLRLRPGAIWIDVEDGTNGTIFGNSQYDNQLFLKGMRDRIRRDGRTVGFYSNQSNWTVITGNWRHDSWSWYATGRSSSSAARAYACNNRRTFGGGTNLYAQYVVGSVQTGQDWNVRC